MQERYGGFEKSVSTAEVIDDVCSMLRKWMVHNTHPRYYGLYNPSVHESAVIADLLTAAFNPQLAAWSQSRGPNEIERYVINFFLERLGFDPATATGSFASGGAEANFQAVPVALTHAFPEYPEGGVAACPARPVFYVSADVHHSFEKIAHVTGLGRDAQRTVAVDVRLRLDVDDLKRRVAADRERGLRPFLVAATAGTTAAGVVDPLDEIARFCREEELWMHVDAAWGGAAVLSPELAPCVKGIESADSVTWDAHKWLSVPMGAGMFFCRHRESVERTFRTSTSYMPSLDGDGVDPYATTMQWSRRFIGLKVFMALAEKGAGGYRREIESMVRMGDALRDRLRRSGWKIVNDTPLPVVCFTHERVEKGDASLTDVVREIHRRGDAWISEVRLGNGSSALRACITSYRTSEDDIGILVERLDEAIR
jgi:glutamate/tyrosine decarboxylase-like PLP-dependent enzyme